LREGTVTDPGARHATVFLIDGIGDQLFVLPAMRALGATFAGRLQLVLGEGMLSFMYRELAIGEVARVRFHDHLRNDAGPVAAGLKPSDVLLSLSTRPYPVAVDLARRIGAKRTFGFHDCFDEWTPLTSDTHLFEQYFAMARRFDPTLRFEDHAGPPVLSSAAAAAAARFARELRGAAERLLFVHPETALPKKAWPLDRVAWVISRFVEAHPEYTVVVQSLEPLALDPHGGRVRHSSCDHLELTIAMLQHVDLFLGVDSCFLHAADLYRVPGVGLFGPSKVAKAGFHLSPVHRHEAGASMDAIAKERVLDALLDVAERVA
jgi:ADP-heptose:LPS heptosyltransferase